MNVCSFRFRDKYKNAAHMIHRQAFTSFFGFCIAIALLVSASGLAKAAYDDFYDDKPPETTGAYVSMLFYRMADTTPDFETWTRASKAYQDASKFDKDMVLQNMSNDLNSAFRSLNTDDPLYISTTQPISKYSKVNAGIFIEGFTDKALTFKFQHLNLNFAVILTNLEDFQWMKMDEKLGKRISRLAGAKKTLPIRLNIVPVDVDLENPVTMDDGKKYWLLLGKIEETQVWERVMREDKLLWSSDDN